jgi:hypothetical protein
MELLYKPKLKPLCAQVTLNPDIININVLNKGYSKTVIVIIPFGGHIEPNSIEGHKDDAKNAQKKPKNNIISDAIKNKKPILKPPLTTLV